MDAPKPRDPIKNALWHVERSVGRTTLDYEEWLGGRDELVRLATPLYVAMLGHMPFYAKWGTDPAKWRPIICSGINASRGMVARSLGRPYQGVSHIPRKLPPGFATPAKPQAEGD